MSTPHYPTRPCTVREGIQIGGLIAAAVVMAVAVEATDMVLPKPAHRALWRRVSDWTGIQW